MSSRRAGAGNNGDLAWSLNIPGESQAPAKFLLLNPEQAAIEPPVIFRIHSWCAAFVDWCVLQLLMKSQTDMHCRSRGARRLRWRGAETLRPAITDTSWKSIGDRRACSKLGSAQRPHTARIARALSRLARPGQWFT